MRRDWVTVQFPRFVPEFAGPMQTHAVCPGGDVCRRSPSWCSGGLQCQHGVETYGRGSGSASQSSWSRPWVLLLPDRDGFAWQLCGVGRGLVLSCRYSLLLVHVCLTVTQDLRARTLIPSLLRRFSLLLVHVCLALSHSQRPLRARTPIPSLIALLMCLSLVPEPLRCGLRSVQTYCPLPSTLLRLVLKV